MRRSRRDRPLWYGSRLGGDIRQGAIGHNEATVESVSAGYTVTLFRTGNTFVEALAVFLQALRLAALAPRLMNHRVTPLQPCGRCAEDVSIVMAKLTSVLDTVKLVRGQ